jgi:hypothetical protein
VNTINTANVIPTPSAILVFFEVDFGTAEAELVLFDVEDGRDEKTGIDADGKRELKGLESERGVFNCCKINSYRRKDLTHSQGQIL